MSSTTRAEHAPEAIVARQAAPAERLPPAVAFLVVGALCTLSWGGLYLLASTILG